ncbi:MAG TPA: NADPH-dependent glutamate synthase [Dehalococcoidales bacterium]|nr:NADPH-dependent glutamate synthase [Dehalococcoidales bacterium]
MTNQEITRVAMPRQAPQSRVSNFNEVALGYNQTEAGKEANRCLQCKKRNCVEGCPVGVNIPEFIKALREDRMTEAVRQLKMHNSLPGICGRVCPQESQCEAYCTLSKIKAPVAIGRLERYVADWERENISTKGVYPSLKSARGKRVAIVGSGPAGLTAAADLAKLGYQVTIFEALHVAGGVLVYGIPEFRLPKDIVQHEVKFVESLGVEIKLDTVIGKLYTVNELLEEGYRAVFLGTGAGLPMFLNIPGENFNAVYSANEYLTRINLMKAFCFPEYDTPIKIGKNVAVIGGGNVAMDSARCALRLGAEKVYLVYRRTREEMPARHEEMENAEEEGVIFKFLANPREFEGDDRGSVKSIVCEHMELGEPDSSGRRRPVIVPGAGYKMLVDMVIVALGTSPNPLITSTTEGLAITRHGTVVTEELTGRTEKDKVWAGGDIVTGSATVISAMGAGRMAAADIDKTLRAKP